MKVARTVLTVSQLRYEQLPAATGGKNFPKEAQT